MASIAFSELPKKPKIAVIGYSGSGKSTLAEELGKRFSVPVLYIDAIHFLPGWVERGREEELSLMREFLDSNRSNGWVIDGNYSNLEYERRMNEADLIVFLSFNRFSCFFRAFKRSRAFKNKTRPSMAAGCDEKFDSAFIKWLLIDGRSKKRRDRFSGVAAGFPEKCVVIKNQRRLDRFTSKL